MAALDPCFDHFVRLSAIISNFQTKHYTPEGPGELDSLIALSADAMITASPSVRRSWRSLHTDTSILRSLPLFDSYIPLDAIATLDRAIIISGAADFSRLDMIHSIIKTVQNLHFPKMLPGLFTSPSPVLRGQTHLDTAIHTIPSLVTLPSLVTFQTHACHKPFIIPGYASEWPAMIEHPWSSAQYLRSVAGPGRVVPVEVGADYRSDDWTQQVMPWDTFLSSLEFPDQPRRIHKDQVLYLAQHNLFMQFPHLRSDFEIPDYVYADIHPSEFPGYIPPENLERLVCNAWLGSKGTISPAHTVCCPESTLCRTETEINRIPFSTCSVGFVNTDLRVFLMLELLLPCSPNCRTKNCLARAT